jgi:selenocysteine lyase/cysteine desulfurase
MKQTQTPRHDDSIELCAFTELPPDFVYLNNGTEGSMPNCVISTYKKTLKKWARNPTTSYETDPILGKRQKENRKRMAEFMGVQQNNICLTDNTTMGLNMVLMGLNFQPGDRVILTDHEHPALISPLWILRERSGIQVEVRPFPEPKHLHQMDSDQLLDFLLPNIPELKNAKALCISHVYNTTGVRLPLDKLKRRVDELNISYLIIDGAQALGMLDLRKPENRLENCDFYAGPTHKWMNGPPGTGILYIKNLNLCPPEFYPVLSQKMGSYMSGDNPGACLPMAEALQVRGCSSTPAYTALIKLMEFYKQKADQAMVENHIFKLSGDVNAFIESRAPNSLVSPSDSELRSGLIAFFPFKWSQPETRFKDKATAEWVVNQLLKMGIQVRFVPFPTVDFSPECQLQGHNPNMAIDCSGEPIEQHYVIRVSTGYFNTLNQIEIFKKALKKVLTALDAN